METKREVKREAVKEKRRSHKETEFLKEYRDEILEEIKKLLEREGATLTFGLTWDERDPIEVGIANIEEIMGKVGQLIDLAIKEGWGEKRFKGELDSIEINLSKKDLDDFMEYIKADPQCYTENYKKFKDRGGKLVLGDIIRGEGTIKWHEPL